MTRTEPKRRKVGILIVAAAILAATLTGAAGAQSGASETTLISRADGVDGAAGNGRSFDNYRVVSEDGRYVAFQSQSTNLHPDDADTASDVFVRDTQTGATILVSRADGAGGDKGDRSSVAPSISDDGRFVAFTSNASNLDPADADAAISNDVYVRDLQNNETTLASRVNGLSGVKASGNSSNPSISGDGRFVAFESSATNLPGDSDATTDIFVRDLQNGTTTLVSRADGPSGEKGNGESRIPSISDDGRIVAFQSRATNLPDDTDTAADIFARDLSSNETTLASRADGADGEKGNGDSFGPSLSGDGNHVVFTSDGDNLHPDDTDDLFDAFARDLGQNTTILASRASGENGAAASGGDFGVSLTSISDNGRFIAFDTNDTNVHPDDSDAIFDIFVRDRQENTTILASRASGADGAKGNSDSDFPSLSGDGGFVAFESSADNLHPDDADTDLDVFLRVLDAPSDTPIDTTITAGPDGLTDENQPTFEFESSRPNSTFECRLDSTAEADFQPCRSPFTTGRLAEGEHTFEVRAIDPSGNPDDTPASRAFTVDTADDPDPPPPNPRGCTITGTSGNDTLRGASGEDIICGLGGNDTVRGLGGDDIIYGDAGNDRLFGQGGDDALNTRDGVRGNDLANGGAGRNRCATDSRDRRVSC